MTREDAERRAAVHNAQDPGSRCFARLGSDGWTVVKVALPSGVPLDPVKEATRVESHPADPPPAYHRFIDPPSGAGV